MRNEANGAAHEDVGYCKPPKEHQFKKGVSGNPRGRGKKQPTIADIVAQTFVKPMSVNIGGRRQSKTALELMLLQLRSQALGKDPKAMRLAFDVLRRYQEEMKPKEVNQQLQGLIDALKAGPVE